MAFTITYTSVTWTTGDIITEAKLDNMVANDQAYDAHSAQGLEFAETTTPSTPASGKVRLYPKADGYMYSLDDTGSETQMGGDLLKLTAAPSADVTANGIKITLTAAENLAFGEVCYINSSGKAAKADADAIATSSVIVMALATISTDAAGSFLVLGIARNDAWNWTVGGLIYLSTTAGALTQTAPSGTDDVIQILGVATHADRMFFHPQLVQVEHT